MGISAAQVKELRGKTGAGMMDCKAALQETGGDVEKAVDHLRKAGILKAAKRAERATGQGTIASYVHAGSRLAVLVEVREASFESDNTDSIADLLSGGPSSSRPPVQIHVHEDAATGRISVQTDVGERELGRADAERMRCDAAVCHQGGRNTTTIPPRTRREVMARDHHRCRAPGCDRTRFLEVHHLQSRTNGGTNNPANLITLCAACHRLWHERRSIAIPAPAP